MLHTWFVLVLFALAVRGIFWAPDTKYVFAYNSTLRLGTDSKVDGHLLHYSTSDPMRVLAHVAVRPLNCSAAACLLALDISSIRLLQCSGLGAWKQFHQPVYAGTCFPPDPHLSPCLSQARSKFSKQRAEPC